MHGWVPFLTRSYLLLIISMGLPKGTVLVGLTRFYPLLRCGLPYFLEGGDLYDGSSTLTFSAEKAEVLTGLAEAWNDFRRLMLGLVGLGDTLEPTFSSLFW